MTTSQDSLSSIASPSSFQPTLQQVKAIAAMHEFLEPTTLNNIFLLAGYAGSGKSTCVHHIIRTLLDQGKRIVLTAPTHKAVMVLRQIAATQAIEGVDFMTIHSLMGLALVKQGSERILEQTGVSYLNLYDVVFLDECSMVNQQLWNFIEQAMDGTGNGVFAKRCPKLILMGDPAQLNPVGEARSPTFGISNRVVLTQVVRQAEESALLQFITDIRKTTRRQPPQPFQPRHDSAFARQTEVLMVRRRQLLHYACQTISRTIATDPDRFRILCWTNKRVDAYNQQIRAYLYGKDAPRFIVGERLVARDPIYAPDGKTVIVQTSTEFTVREVAEDHYSGYQVWKLIVVTDDGMQRQIYVRHESDAKRFEHEAGRLLQGAKRNPVLWRRYYQHLETFAQVRPSFALTVHNAQGSTFSEVGIDALDLKQRLSIGSDRYRHRVREFNRLWYVAASRARERILVVPD